MYFANNIVIHNCRRAFMPVTDVEVPDTSAELAEWQTEQQAQWEREGLL